MVIGRCPLFLAIAIGLGGCNAQPTQENKDDANTSLTERTDFSLSAAETDNFQDYPSGYLEMKEAAGITRVSYGNFVIDDRSTDYVTLYSHFLLLDCMENDDDEPSDKWREDPLEQLAKRVVGFTRGLEDVGYWKEVFQTPINEYEGRQLRILTQAISSVPEPQLADGEARSDVREERELQRLVDSFEVNRKRFQPEMPSIKGNEGCGGGETPYQFRAIPSGATVWIASSFSFALCKARKMNPWDYEVCDRWTEVSDGRPRYLSGRFVYNARWPDGSTGRGVRDLTGGGSEVDSEYNPVPKTVIVRPSLK